MLLKMGIMQEGPGTTEEKKEFGMNKMEKWNNVESFEQLDKLIEDSYEKPVVVFKHSTRCSISSMVLNRLQRDWDDEEMKNIDFYYLDLISFREISNRIAEKLGVTHQSPQLIVIRNGKAVFHTSHMGVEYGELKKQVA